MLISLQSRIIVLYFKKAMNKDWSKIIEILSDTLAHKIFSSMSSVLTYPGTLTSI